MKKWIVLGVLAVCSASVAAQWPKIPDPAVPRDAKGNINYDAPTPRTPDDTACSPRQRPCTCNGQASPNSRATHCASWRRLRNQTDPADVEVFFEAIQLEEIGELEGADVAAAFPDLPLEIADDPLEVGFGEAGVEELKPEPFPVKAQAHALAGEPAI